MKVRDITEAIEAFAPLSIQEGWDNSGLCIGSMQDEVHGVLIGFDCTPDLVEEAVKTGADMIITHHPLIFNGLKKISPEDPVGLAVIRAVKAGIAVYAAHTTADKVIEGVSGAMAEKLGLEDVHILECDDGEHGLGAVGSLPREMDSSSAVKYVKERFGVSTARVSRPIDVPVRKIAMCGGSGSSLIRVAMDSGAQLYVSADISYHHFFTPEGFMVMDIGHFESEVEITSILFSLLRKKFPTFAIRVSDNLNSSNPVYYL